MQLTSGQVCLDHSGAICGSGFISYMHGDAVLLIFDHVYLLKLIIFATVLGRPEMMSSVLIWVLPIHVLLLWKERQGILALNLLFCVPIFQ